MLDITSAVEFLFTEAGVNRCSTETLLYAAFLKTPREACKCTEKGLYNRCFSGKFTKILEQLFFRNTNVDASGWMNMNN